MPNLQAIPSPQVFVPAGAPPEAMAFFGRMTAAGASPSATQRTAITGLFDALKAIGLAKFIAVWPIIGGTAATHALDLLDAHDVTWSGGLTHDAGGVTGNGSTGLGDTGIDLTTTAFGQNDGHIAAYCRTTATSGHVISAHGTFPNRFTATTGPRSDLGRYYFIVNTDSSFSNALGNALGTYLASRLNSSTQVLYINGAEALSASRTSTGVPSNNLTLLAQHRGGATYGEHSNGQIAFAGVGLGLTAGEAADLSAAVQQFQTTLGRAV